MVSPQTSTVPAHPIFCDRRHDRTQVEMAANIRRNLVSSNVVLRDLTRYGARIEGVVGTLRHAEAVSLGMPGCRPAMAFVAWTNDNCAGVEFAQPLDRATFGNLVSRYGRDGELAAQS